MYRNYTCKKFYALSITRLLKSQTFEKISHYPMKSDKSESPMVSLSFSLDNSPVINRYYTVSRCALRATRTAGGWVGELNAGMDRGFKRRPDVARVNSMSQRRTSPRVKPPG